MGVPVRLPDSGFALENASTRRDPAIRSGNPPDFAKNVGLVDHELWSLTLVRATRTESVLIDQDSPLTPSARPPVGHRRRGVQRHRLDLSPARESSAVIRMGPFSTGAARRDVCLSRTSASHHRRTANSKGSSRQGLCDGVRYPARALCQELGYSQMKWERKSRNLHIR